MSIGGVSPPILKLGSRWTPQSLTLGMHWIEGWMDPIASPDALEKWKISRPRPGIEQRFLAFLARNLVTALFPDSAKHPVQVQCDFYRPSRLSDVKKFISGCVVTLCPTRKVYNIQRGFFTIVSTSPLITITPTRLILTKFSMEIFQGNYVDILKWNRGWSSFNSLVRLSEQPESKGKNSCLDWNFVQQERKSKIKLSFAITSYPNSALLDVRMSGQSQEWTHLLKVQDPVSIYS